MNLRYVLDENLRGPLWRAISWHNAQGAFPLDVVRIGDSVDLPLGISDPEVLGWAEGAQRILVSSDRNTLAGHLSGHLAAGRQSPGILLVRPHATIPATVSFLVEAADASVPEEWRDRIVYIP